MDLTYINRDIEKIIYGGSSTSDIDLYIENLRFNITEKYPNTLKWYLITMVSRGLYTEKLEGICYEDIELSFELLKHSKSKCKDLKRLEKEISTSGYHSYMYAIEVLKGRFELGEKEITRNSELRNLYSKFLMKITTNED